MTRILPGKEKGENSRPRVGARRRSGEAQRARGLEQGGVARLEPAGQRVVRSTEPWPPGGHAGAPTPHCIHGAQARSGSELEEPSERHTDRSPKVPTTRLPHNMGMDRHQGVMGEEWLLGPRDPSSCQVTTPAGCMLKGDGGDAGGQRQARA